MLKNNRYASIAILFILAFLTGLLGVGDASASWTQSSFQIGGYSWFLSNTPRTDSLKLLNDAGLDWTICYGQHNATPSKSLADSIEWLRVNKPPFPMKSIAVYSSYDNDTLAADAITANSNASLDPSLIEAVLNPAWGLNKTSTLGWNLWDEPCGPAEFSKIKVMQSIIRTFPASSNQLAHVNLNPIAAYGNIDSTVTCYQANYVYVGGDTLSREAAYARYVRTYLSQYDDQPVPAPVLAFDSYPFQSPAQVDTSYFRNLRIARDCALEYSRPGALIPLWVTVQLSPFRQIGDSAYRGPFTIAHTRMQAFSALAYGAKGIAYWLMTYARNSATLEDWGAGVLSPTGDTVAVKYSQLREMNRQIHNLGPILMKLDPVTVLHAQRLGWDVPKDELYGNQARVYNMIKDIGLQSDSLMVGHLKHRETGDDYLLVVNKALVTTRSYSLTLANRATSIYRIDRGTGATINLGAGTSISATGLDPGQGELFQVVDSTYEYIPDVRVIATDGTREYYGHSRGVVMVDRATGRRTYHVDGNVFTPVSDLAITNNHVFICQDNGGASGSVMRANRDLSAPVLFRWTAGRPLAITAQRAESVIVIVDRLSAASSRLRVISGLNADSTSIAFDDGGGIWPYASPYVAYDVHCLEGLKSFVVAHGAYYSRILSAPPYTLLTRVRLGGSGTSDVNLTSIGSGLSQTIFAGRDDGVTGRLDKMNYNLVRPSPNGFWPAGGTSPSFKAVDARGNHVLFGSTSSSGDYFVRLRALDLASYSPYKLTSLPRAVALNSDSVALMANAAGVYRSSQGNLSGTYLVEGGPDSSASSPDSLGFGRLELALSVSPNPVTDLATLRFVNPQSALVELVVFDVAGRRLKTLMRGVVAAGEHSAEWRVPGQGVYFARLKSASGVRIVRIVGR